MQMRNRIKSITDDYNFTKAVKITIASVIPVLLLFHFNEFAIGFNVALAHFCSSTSDIPSNLKHKINGILVAILITFKCYIFSKYFTSISVCILSIPALLVFFYL
jgi:uncharacterized membrane protein YccC